MSLTPSLKPQTSWGKHLEEQLQFGKWRWKEGSFMSLFLFPHLLKIIIQVTKKIKLLGPSLYFIIGRAQKENLGNSIKDEETENT